jgi:hypothetical protein
VVQRLGGATFEAHEPVRPLDLAREEQLGEDGLDGYPVLEHDGDEGLVHSPQQGRQRLLDGKIEYRLLHRRQLERALTKAADGLGDGQRAGPCRAGHVPLHAYRGDEPDALLVAPPHLGAEHARRDHAGVARWLQTLERQRVAAGHDDEGVGTEGDGQAGDDIVGHEEADDVGVTGGLDVCRREAVGFGRLPRLVVAHADSDVDARVAHVQRPRAPLVAVADDRDPLAFEGAQVGVGLMKDLAHDPDGSPRSVGLGGRRDPSRLLGLDAADLVGGRHHPHVVDRAGPVL